MWLVPASLAAWVFTETIVTAIVATAIVATAITVAAGIAPAGSSGVPGRGVFLGFRSIRWSIARQPLYLGFRVVPAENVLATGVKAIA